MSATDVPSIRVPPWVRLGASALLLLWLLLFALQVFVGLDKEGGFRPAVAFFFVAFGLGFGVYTFMGALILFRRGSHLIGWMLMDLGIILLVMVGSGDYAGYTLVRHPGSLPFGQVAVILSQTLWTAGVYQFAFLLPLTFPTGRLLSWRWALVLVVGAVFIGLALAGNALSPDSHPQNYPQIQNPIAIKGHDQLFQTLQNIALVVVIAAVAGAIASVVVRYRRSRGIERQQLKWFLLAMCLIPVALALNNVPMFDQISFIIALPLLGISVALAVLRYGLYEIDIVINRALVYGALAAFITAVYVGIVVGAGILIGSGGRPNLFLSIIATAIVAVAFQPVRERMQKVANRLVYGKRATPYEVLSQFSERVAETYAAEEALPRMARVLADGTGAEQAQVWLRTGSVMRPAASWPEGDGSTTDHQPVPVHSQLLPDLPCDQAVPVRHQGELLGAITVTKRQGETLTPIEQKLLDDLAHQAGLVLKNVGLTADLQARLEELRLSRQRLVKAQDDERRRLERNLHDGAQQNLVALKVKLGLAEMTLVKDPAKATQLIAELKSDSDEALETLRDLARGIYPPLLADQGLKAALEAQARKATVSVEVDADGIGRYPQETEAAVYFCVLEALQNVQKYAGATGAAVHLEEQDGELRFEVDDDGRGFAGEEITKGSGLQNMEDRLDALGGRVQISSSPGHGVNVTGAIPVQVEVRR